MRPKVFLGIGLLGALLLLAIGPSLVRAEEDADAPLADSRDRAIRAWNKTCFKCHAVPDPRYETDRAFLRQVMDTT